MTVLIGSKRHRNIRPGRRLRRFSYPWPQRRLDRNQPRLAVLPTTFEGFFSSRRVRRTAVCPALVRYRWLGSHLPHGGRRGTLPRLRVLHKALSAYRDSPDLHVLPGRIARADHPHQFIDAHQPVSSLVGSPQISNHAEKWWRPARDSELSSVVTHRILPIIISGEVNTYPREIESRLIVHLCRVIGDPLLPAGTG